MSKVEAELRATAADAGVRSEAETGTRSEEKVPMESALGMDRNFNKKKKQELFQEKKHLEGSEAWDEDIREVAMARLQ